MLAVVGPGRVGQALGRRLREGGVPLLGFVGKDPRVTAAAVAFAGGEVLEASDLARATWIMLAVQDDRLPSTAAELARQISHKPAAHKPAAHRPDAPRLCFHVSGAHDLEVLAPLAAAGLAVGSLHPVCPLPDVAAGYENLPQQPAVLAGASDVVAVLQELAEKAGLRPVIMSGGDRLLYHTACVLAANGVTALFGRLEELFQVALGQPGATARPIPAALMQKAVAMAAEHGGTDALSGPVARGDSRLVARQLENLQQVDPQLADLYRLLMQQALRIVEQRRDLEPDVLARLREVLDG